MKLDLDRTPGGQSAVSLAGRCDLDFGPGGPGTVTLRGVLRVDNLEGRCVVRGELTAVGPATCDRCLREFDLEFPVPLELLILRDAGREDDDSDTAVLHQRDGVVDLTDAVREAAVLAVPLARICQAACRGICSGCGADLNETACVCAPEDPDPRWADLPD